MTSNNIFDSCTNLFFPANLSNQAVVVGFKSNWIGIIISTRNHKLRRICDTFLKQTILCKFYNFVDSQNRIYFRAIFIMLKMIPNMITQNARLYLIPYLMVLVRRDCNERRFREHVRAESGVFGSKSVIFICFYDVNPGLIFMHGIQDNLERK